LHANCVQLAGRWDVRAITRARHNGLKQDAKAHDHSDLEAEDARLQARRASKTGHEVAFANLGSRDQRTPWGEADHGDGIPALRGRVRDLAARR
jgi:hypothetical protein